MKSFVDLKHIEEAEIKNQQPHLQPGNIKQNELVPLDIPVHSCGCFKTDIIFSNQDLNYKNKVKFHNKPFNFAVNSKFI
jgi:hypothetical protein